MRNGNRRNDSVTRNEQRGIPANERTREEARHAEVIQRIGELGNALYVLLWKAYNMSKEMDDLQAQVQSTKGVIQSAVVLIRGLKERLDEAGTDPAKLNAIREDLDQRDDELAAAVAANSPPSGGGGGSSGGASAGGAEG